MTAATDMVGGAPAPESGMRRLARLATDRSEAGTARRVAATAFAARVLNAGIGFATQILLARWMGEREYGIYAYVWVCVLVAGGLASLGLPVAALKFVPDYTTRGDLPGLRGFLRFSRTAALLPAAGGALLAAVLLLAFAGGEAAAYGAVGLLALVILPVYVLTDIQTGIARAYDDIDLGLMADYLLRPALLLLGAGAIFLAGGGGTAVTVMAATLGAVAVTAAVQGWLLQARIRRRVSEGPARFDLRRWGEASWPLLTVTGFTLLLGSTDILVLKLFVGPEEIALYFAATKIVAIASFVSYGVSNTSAHRFAGHVANGDRPGMAALAAETVRWTFWPTLAVALALAGLAGPLLSLFGPQFASGHAIVAILGFGLVLGAAVGPADRALAMADQGRAAAWIYAVSFVANLVLALALIPALGLSGAALATALAMGVRALLLHALVRRRLGLDMFVFARTAAPARAAPLGGIETELLLSSDAARLSSAWHDLAGRSIEPNVFYAPEVVLAGARHLPGGRSVRILAAWRGDREGRRLVGLLPVAPGRGRHLNPFPLRRAAAFYSTLSTPLLDPVRPDETLHAMLRSLARHGVAGVAFPHLHAGGPAAVALDEICHRHGLVVTTIESHRRAMLRSEAAGAGYVRATLETRRRKEVDRQRRRLAEEGTLAFAVVTAGPEVADALEAFLALEKAGWKGTAGTALAVAPGAAGFSSDMAAGLAARNAFRIATLSLDGRIIAAGLVAIAGRRAFYLKTAYDEAFSRFSPGLLLTLDLTVHLLDDPAIDDADSIAVADHSMIDRIWTGRFPIASVVVSTRPGGGAAFRAAASAERLRERAIEALKAKRAAFAEWRQARVHPPAKKETPSAAA